MKVVICSLGGSVGKTTITTHMLAPRMPSAKLIAVDTTNTTAAHFGLDAEAFSGDEFANLYKQIVRMDDAIIDVGGSKEGKEFLAGMNWLDGQDEIDYFVIPSMPEDKDQKAAWKTIELLLDQGVAKEKIKVVFNGVKKNTADEFDYLLGALSANEIPFSLDATIFHHALFDSLSAQQRSIQSILADETNYKKAVQTCEDESELTRLCDLMIAQKSAPKVAETLDAVFAALFPAVKTKRKAA